MKILPYLSLLFVIFTACKNTDPALANALTLRYDMAVSQQGYFDEIAEVLRQQTAEFEVAPEAFKADTTTGFNRMVEEITLQVDKNAALRAEYTDLLNRLNELSQQYKAGSVDAAAVKEEHQLIDQQLNAALQSAEKIKEVYGEVNSRFMEAYQEWDKRTVR